MSRLHHSHVPVLTCSVAARRRRGFGVGRRTRIAYTRPTPFFRRPDAGFFGKILKLFVIVISPAFARFPEVRRRPSLWGGWWLVRVVLGCGVLAAGPASADPGPQAERIVSAALATFTRVGSFSARLRQKARIGDRVLVGTGRYLQTGQGEEQKFRFESTLESESESFELLELSDGLFSWTYRRDGPQPPTLYRTDVRRVHDRLVELGCPTPDDTAAYLGGLPRVLWLTRQSMQFTTAESRDIDGTPMWVVEGTWAPGGLASTGPPLQARIEKGEQVAPSDLPDGVPWSVRLAIGRGDLVPRRIEWLAIPGTRPVPADAPLEPIAVFELFDIEIDGHVEPASFFYQPAVTGLMDVTEQHVKTLGLFRP